MAADSKLDQKYLKEIIHYDPKTGIFKWRKTTGSAKAGKAILPENVRDDSYLSVGINRKRHLLHRIAFLYMTGRFPENFIDHINGNKSDNRWKNLREVTHAENNKNRRCQLSTDSGVCGVCKLKPGKTKRLRQFRAVITVNRVVIYLGAFKTLKEAKAARIAAERLHGFHRNHGKKRAARQKK